MLEGAQGASPAAPVGSPDVDVAVIGAGPHGLSAAAHLIRAGVRPYVIGDPMSFWKTMPTGMMLRSNVGATSMVEREGPLSLPHYMRETGTAIEQPVALERFLDYGLWVAKRVAPEVDRRTVTRLEHASGRFSLEFEDGAVLTARRVVLAGGIAPFEYVPAEFELLPEELVSHSGHHRDPSRFAGQMVAVVGGGQSAFELAVLMKEAGADRVDVIVRDRYVVWLRGHAVKQRIGPLGPIFYAPTDVGPSWYSRLVERPRLLGCLPRSTQDRIAARSIRPACSNFVRVRLGGVNIQTRTRLIRARESAGGIELRFSDERIETFDHLIFATGYVVNLSRYRFLAPSVLQHVELRNGYPVLDRGLESTLPGLHITGAPAAWSFGPIMRFVSGSWFAGRELASTIASRRVPVRT